MIVMLFTALESIHILHEPSFLGTIKVVIRIKTLAQRKNCSWVGMRSMELGGRSSYMDSGLPKGIVA